MSKPSSSSAKNQPLPAQSAWSRGPPVAAAASSRSQSPAPPSAPQTHSRRPSALGPGIPIKDGVSIPRNNVGSLKQSQPVTFGSIDDASAPISSSPAAAPTLKSEIVRSFGTVPAQTHVNGKASISSRPSALPAQVASAVSSGPTPLASSPSTASSSSATAPAPDAAPVVKPKIDIKKMFQNPTSTPSTSTPASDTSSPAMRSAPLPPQPPSGLPASSSQLGSQPFVPFIPSGNMRPPQSSGPNGGPPRSPQISRPMANGSGLRSQGPQNGAAPSAGMSSPRLGPHPHPSQSAGGPNPMPPQIPPQMQPQMHPNMGTWPGYYAYPPPEYYMWYPQQMGIPPPHLPPSTPAPHMPQHGGMPMSPRNPTTALQGPGTPTLAHTHPVPGHPPPPPITHATSAMAGLTSPPATPSSASGPPPRLNAGSSAFVPSNTIRKVTLKKDDGTEVDLGALSKNPPAAGPNVPRQPTPGTPTRRPASIRIESEDQRRSRLEQEQKEAEKVRLKAEAEEKAKKDQEEAARKAKEDEENKKRVEAEAAQKREEEEKQRQEDLRKAEETRKAKEEEQRLADEAERQRKAKEEEEEAARKQAEEEERQKVEEEERKRRASEEEEAGKRREADEEQARKDAEEKERLEKEAIEVAPAAIEDGKADASEEAQDDKSEEKINPRSGLRINTSPLSDRRQRPGPLDLTSAKSSSISAPLPSALATARIINDISTIAYPEGIQSPRPDLNQNAKEGKFRYDRDFLLQFMTVCKEKPPMLPPLDVIGLEPNDQAMIGRGSRSSSSTYPHRQNSGLGIMGPGGSMFNKPAAGAMGQFTTVGKPPSSEDRVRAAFPGGPIPFRGGTAMQRTPSQPGAIRDRTRSKRGEKRGENNKPSYHQQQQQQQQALNLEPVVPLQATENRWDRRALAQDQESPEVVDRKVRSLLNKLTMERFDSISDQIITWANKSEKETDGRTLIQVIRLVFEKATDESTWSEMYARLCRKMMEQISPNIHDEGIKHNDGKPIAGGQLFRKYLLNRCQEDFYRGWANKQAAAAAAASKAVEDEAAKAAQVANGDEVALYSEEYYIAQKAKRQGLGLVKFIGELFKLQMLTERIMHECVKNLLGNVDNPEEEDIESLCKLLSTVGGLLDTPKAKAHLDIYFARMKELTKSQHVTSRMQYMLQDVIELRDRKWQVRHGGTIAAPATIAQIHEAAAKEKAAAEKESYQRQISMSRGGSRRGGDRGEAAQVTPDGWSVPRAASKAGDLSKFGQISKGEPMTFGPASVFAGGKKGSVAGKRDSISRTASASNLGGNMFSALEESATKAPEPAIRKRLVLQPRTKQSDEQDVPLSAEPEQESGSNSEEEEAVPEMSAKDASKKVDEDLKEFFAVRNLEEAEDYFSKLPAVHHHTLIEKLVSKAVESKEADAKLVAEFFALAVSKELCSASAFEEGLGAMAEAIMDIAIDAPKAPHFFATMVKAANLDESVRSALGGKPFDASDQEKLRELLLA